MVMYDNEFETKENKVETKDKIEPQHMYVFTNQKLQLYNQEIVSEHLPQLSSKQFHDQGLHEVTNRKLQNCQPKKWLWSLN